MLQLKQHKFKVLDGSFFLLLYLIAFVFGLTSLLSAQGYDDTFDMRNKIKVEIQYADYWEYEYPEPIIFRYGVQDYSQTLPYLVNFPEKRGLIKFTRLLGSRMALSAKYQYSDLRTDVDQHLGEAKVTTMFGESLVGLIGFQIINDTRGYNAFQPGIGFRWDVGPLTTLQADAQYYYRGKDAEPVGGELGSLNLRFKIRQVLTLSTAMFVEYMYFGASGESIEFTSHSASIWLSQFLPTQTALHLNLRLYDNSIGVQSMAPSVEIAQYINWATVLRLKYRYYTNRSENVSLGEEEIIIPDNLKSHAASIQLNREISPDLLAYCKYRYYKSNLGIEMNTYMLGFIYSF